MHILKKSKIEQIKKSNTNRWKKGIFLGTSILNGFWEGLGRVLGGQNHQFSHFFRCFFEAKFEARFRSAKNRPKRPKRHRKRKLGSGLRWSPPSWGEIIERGIENMSELPSWIELVGQISNIYEIIQHAVRTFGGRRIEGPQGGTPPPPNFRKAFGATYASVVCTDGCTDRWRSRVGWLRLGDFAFSERP